MADVNKAVLVTFGAVGQEKLGKALTSTAAKVAAVTAAVIYATKKISDFIDGIADFSKMAEQTTIRVEGITSATKGLISSTSIYTQALKLQEAERNITNKEFEAMGKAAASLANKLGEGEVGATARLEQLTDAVIKGQKEALIPYGITLQDNADKSIMAADAVRQLVEKYGDLDIALVGHKDNLAAVGNILGTVVNFEMSYWVKGIDQALGSIIGNGGMIDAMEAWQYDLISTRGEMAKYSTMLGDINVQEIAHDEQLWENIRAGESWQKTLLETTRIGGLDAAETLIMARNYRQLAGQMRINIEMAERLNRAMGGNAAGVALGAKAGMSMAKSSVAENFKQKAARRAGGGGRSAAVAVDEYNYSPRLAEYSTPTATDSATMGGSGLGELAGIGTGAGAIDARSEASQAGRAASFEQQMRLEQERQIAMQDSERNGLAVMLGLEKDAMAERRKMYKEDADYRVSSNLAAVGAVTDIFSNLSDTVDASTEKGFRAQKAMAISAGVVNTTLASIAAFRSVIETVPYPANLVLAPITAASVMAAGMAAVAQIAKTQYGGGAQSGSSTSFSAGGLGASAAQQSGGQTIIIPIVIDGQTVHSSMINANRRASQSGSPAFAMR